MRELIPYDELPQDDQNTLVAWVRSEQERERQKNPWVFARREMPDGTTADSSIHKLRLSALTRKNDGLVASYLLSQRAREEKIAKWEQAVKAEAKAASEQFKAAKRSAEEAAVKPIKMSDSATSRELLAYRKTHVARVKAPEPQLIPRPDISWTDADALWIETEYFGEGGITHYDEY